MTTSGHGGGEPKRHMAHAKWKGWVLWGCLGVVLLAILTPRQRLSADRSRTKIPPIGTQVQRSDLPATWQRPKPAATAEEIVAGKVNQFARDRLRIARAMAKRLKLELPAEVEQFFNAVAAGR